MNADAAALVVASAHTTATTITLPTTGAKGSAIVWTSSNDALINPATGAVVMPSSGQVVVTLTATLTLNAATKQVTFEVTVGTASGSQQYASDLFISEYIEGSSNNKALEIYNGTGAAVDLSVYSVALYTNGATEPLTRALTGTLAHGEVLVIANSQAIQTILDQADIVIPFVSGQFGANWNGDDAIALMKNGTAIDVFGVIGTDPGSSWVVGTGTTADYTLVRASTVMGPSATWDPAQWVVNPKDTVTFLGSHTMGQPA